MLSLCPFDISVGVGAFVIGLGQISSFLSSNDTNIYIRVPFCNIIDDVTFRFRLRHHFNRSLKKLWRKTS